MDILIVEDEKPAQLQLQKLLREVRPGARVAGTADSIASAVAFFRSQPPPDLALMDIQLADGLSFAIFSQVEVPCPVIFTTAYDQYSLRAFKVNSVDYLLKPVDPEELTRALDKYERVFHTPPTMDPALMRRMISAMEKPTYKERFLIRSGQHLSYVQAADIRYFFSDDGLTFARSADGKKHHLDYSLDQLEELLDPDSFFRISRKVFLRLEAIRRMSTYFNGRLILKLRPEADFDIIVSRDRVGGFKEWLDR